MGISVPKLITLPERSIALSSKSQSQDIEASFNTGVGRYFSHWPMAQRGTAFSSSQDKKNKLLSEAQLGINKIAPPGTVAA